MCNKLFQCAKPIPEEGYGWKVIDAREETLRAFVHLTEFSEGIIVWDGTKVNIFGKADGFLFLPYKKRSQTDEE